MIKYADVIKWARTKIYGTPSQDEKGQWHSNDYYMRDVQPKRMILPNWATASDAEIGEFYNNPRHANYIQEQLASLNRASTLGKSFDRYGYYAPGKRLQKVKDAIDLRNASKMTPNEQATRKAYNANAGNK